MAGLPQFPISTQTDPYWEIPMYDSAGNPLSIEGRVFEAWIAPATTKTGVAAPVEEIKVLTFQDGLTLVPPTDGGGDQTVKNTLVHQVSRKFAQDNFPRGELTADILEVVDGARRLFAPVRLFYADPAQIREFVADRAGITFGPGRQPIVTPVAIAGQAGRRGSGLLTGTLPPQPSDGEDGDYWVVERVDQANVVYGPKEGGEWPPQPSSTFGVGGVADVPGLPVALGEKADVESPVFTGTVKAPALQIQGEGSTGPVDGMTVGGTPLSTVTASTAYMPPPSGNAATDAANFAAAQAKPVRVILFQAGEYLIPDTGYAALKPGQEVAGQGLLKTTLKAATAMAAGNEGILRGFEAPDVTIRDLTVDYGGLREPAAGWAPLSFRNVNVLRITNVGVKGWSRFAISINGGVDWRIEVARLVRTPAPIKADGSPIAKGEQNQALVVSQSANPVVGGYFGRSYCEGSAVNISGSFLTFEDNEINGFDFGFGFVSEQDPHCHHHQYLRNRVRGGRTNPATGLDVNATSAGGFEMWAPYTLLDGNEMWDLGGDGIVLGAKNSRVVNNTVRNVGKQVISNGIVSRYELGGAYSAHGSIIANNTVPNTNGSGDGSNLNLPYSEQDLTGDMVVRLVGNDFGATPLTRKGIGARWASPGLFFKVSAGGYTHSPGSLLIPADLSLPGARRSGDVIVGVAFKGNDGSALPAGLRAFAEVTSDNVVKFYTQDISGGSSNIAVPAGTFSARLVSID